MIERTHASRRRLRIECLEDRCLLSAAGEFYQPPQVHLRDVDGFLTGPSTDEPFQIAIDYARGHADALGLMDGDLDDFVVTDQYITDHNGVTHLYLRQTYRGLEVLGANLSVNVSADGRVINAAASFVPDLDDTAKAAAPQPGLTAGEALIAWAEDSRWMPDPISWSKGSAGSAPAVLSALDDLPQTTLLAGSGISLDEIPAELHYVPMPNGGVELAWNLNVRTTDGLHWYDTSVSAVDGDVLSLADRVKAAASPQYNVLALPLGSPDDGPQSLQLDPADPIASPFGWHDTNGSAGAEFTDTRGNNVFARDDRDGDDAGGFRPDGGAELNFDFPMEPDGSPIEHHLAAITNAFYWGNILHDIHYQYGFDEVSGNFQSNNYGRGGTGGDYLILDSHDRDWMGNAAFFTLPEGETPWMELGILLGAAPEVTIDAPAAIAGSFVATEALFGPPATPAGLSGRFVAVDPLLGCDPITNPEEIDGKIAVIDRGDCFFVEKVKAAQNAGALGVLIINNVADAPVFMAGDDVTITIPALMVSQADGALIRTALADGPVDGSLSWQFRDFSLDNEVIIHEYGHGVSTRLTGGPHNTNTLDGVQSGAMGEGWGDWWGLMLTQNASDAATTPREFGQYVSYGIGFRRYPYSFDMAINPLTYADIVGNPEVHAAGEIWASALWDLNWLLIDGDGWAMSAMGFDPDFYQGTGGNNLALQLILDGLKLQPANPTMLDARDAILLADTINNGGANHRAIWTAFARRGMGLSADDGGDHNSTAVVEAFDLPSISAIAGRHVFYNNSAWDTPTDDDPDSDDPDRGDPDRDDDTAIAIDKTALLPGQTATTVNYTNYSRGINGIMVDVADLPAAGPTIDADDYFQFQIGNDGPGGWTDAPDPISATVRPGDGDGASDRITLTWADNAIEQQWLRVTVLANAKTGIEQPDIFHFGNAIGEAGDRAGNTIVNATDEIAARNFQHGALDPATIDDPYDYNRDGVVNGTDQLIARSHQTNPLTMLRLIAAPVIAKGAVTKGAIDAVLEQASAEALASGIDWLYELEQSRAKRRSVATGATVEMAVDMLLTAR